MEIKRKYEKFSFHPTSALPSVDKILRPWIKVRLATNDKRTPFFYALVDSGSDFTLFPTGVGKYLGIDVSTGPTVQITGIGGGVTAFFHDVTLSVAGYKASIRAGFSDSQILSQISILGSLGFFDRFEVILDYNRKSIILIPNDTD